MDDGYRHYVRADEQGRVIHGFSEAFEQPQEGDILLTDQGIRQFQEILKNGQGIPLYKVVAGQMVAREKAEIDADIAALPAPSPTVEERLAAAESVIISLLGV